MELCVLLPFILNFVHFSAHTRTFLLSKMFYVVKYIAYFEWWRQLWIHWPECRLVAVSRYI